MCAMSSFAVLPTLVMTLAATSVLAVENITVRTDTDRNPYVPVTPQDFRGPPLPPFGPHLPRYGAPHGYLPRHAGYGGPGVFSHGVSYAPYVNTGYGQSVYGAGYGSVAHGGYGAAYGPVGHGVGYGSVGYGAGYGSVGYGAVGYSGVYGGGHYGNPGSGYDSSGYGSGYYGGQSNGYAGYGSSYGSAGYGSGAYPGGYGSTYGGH